MDIETALFITTAIMALGTIIFSSLTMAFGRSHNRKSVRPFCNLLQNVTDTQLSISIQNPGMGPMRIQEILLLKNQDDPIEAGVSLKDALPLELKHTVFKENTEEYVLASLGELNLLRYTTDTPNNGEMTQLKETLNGCSLCITYEDIYDHSYEKRGILTL
ncbi:MAG: hypothetical protein Q8898_17480 [Bacillota bacterium]|nr:hypothetical protein [Bacillota bacterium]